MRKYFLGKIKIHTAILFSQETNHQIKEAVDKCSICKLEKQQLDEERQEFIQQKTKLELEIKDLQEAIKEDNNAKETDKKQMSKLEEKIKTKEEALSKITPDYNEKKSSEGDISARFVIFRYFFSLPS